MRHLVAGIVVAVVATVSSQTDRILEGRIVDDRGRPVRGVTVIVVPSTGGPRMAGISDENGGFSIHALPQGQAKVTIDASPLVVQTPVVGELPDVAAVLEPGEIVRPLMVTLVRGAALSGTVFSAGTGAPAMNIRVTASRVGSAARDRELVRTSRTSATGSYRFAGLPEGAYIVGAADVETAAGDTVIHGSAEIDGAFDALALRAPLTPTSPAALLTIAIPTFYPGTTAVSDAQPIPLQAGTEQQGIDITLLSEGAASLIGTFRNHAGQPLTGGRLRLFSVGSDGAVSARMIPLLLDARGQFSKSGLAPGTYRLVGEIAPSDRQPGAIAERTFDLHSGERMELELDAGQPPRVTVAVVSDTFPPEEMGAYSIRLERAASGTRLAPFDDIERQIIDARGEFSTVLPGIYHVSVRGGTGVVERVKAAGSSHADWLTVTSSQTQKFELSLTRPGKISGRVVGCEAGSEVVLFLREEGEWVTQSHTMRTTIANPDCSFSILSVVPGAYWISALASHAPSIARADFLRSLVASATRVDVRPSAVVDVTLPRRQ